MNLENDFNPDEHIEEYQIAEFFNQFSEYYESLSVLERCKTFYDVFTIGALTMLCIVLILKLVVE
jgi:hypothetical protein